MQIQISQFYNCDKITTGAELFLVCELGKYLKNYGYELSLEGVIFSEDLVNSKYWLYYSYALSNNYIGKQGVYDFQLKDSDLLEPSEFFLRDLSEVGGEPVFSEKTSEKWVWKQSCANTSDEVKNNKIMCGTNRNQALVSLIAMVMVDKLLDKANAPQKLELVLEEVFCNQNGSSALVYIIMQNTNALDEWFSVQVSNIAEALYEAWVYNNIDMGYARRNINIVSKRDYFHDNDFQIGDVVLLYKRNERQRSSYYRAIESCSIATIYSVTDSHLTFKIINTNETTLTTKKRLESYKDEVRAMFTKVPTVRISTENVQWMDIGIGRQTYLESSFILPLNVSDTTYQWVERVVNGVREEQRVKLDSVEAIYWILKDRGIDFNEEHFRSLYFGDKSPLYDIYMAGGNINEMV